VKYFAELSFLEKFLDKCQLPYFLSTAKSPQLPGIERSILKLFPRQEAFSDYLEGFFSAIHKAEPRIVYKLTDPFYSTHLFFLLPDTQPSQLFLAGPYLSSEPTEEQLLELAEKIGIPPRNLYLLKDYYGSLPLFHNENPVFSAIYTFCETIWDTDQYTIVDINQELLDIFANLFSNPASGTEETMHRMRSLEQRYAFENDMLQAISQGQTHKIERIFSRFTENSIEQRCADPLRNMKNYCIIMNTLFRKAAENGAVHPIYLDRVSSDFARKIELISSSNAISSLMEEMFRTYCRLVRRHSTKQYSLPVQKAIIYMDSDLSSDLSLKTLANLQNVSASYLSSLFKKETGQTITDYVNNKRVRLAMQLLGTTKLQIQTIAQHCGILDVNYFTKMFKKYVGQTPKEYRKAIQTQMASTKK